MDFATYLVRLGRNLRRARWRAGKTQQEVAAAGVTLRYLADLERGYPTPWALLLCDLAQTHYVGFADLAEVGQRRAPVDLAKVPESSAPKPGRKPTPKRRRSSST
ncbi:MAG: helix-turn-helix domain-containing protein [Polyangiales bacterium]